MAKYQHGIITTESGAYGLYTDVTADYSEELAEAGDADGDVIQTTVKINCIFDTSKTLPALLNSTVTLSGGKTTGAFRVTHVNIFALDLKRMAVTCTVVKHMI